MVIKSIESKQDLENALNRVNELWDIAKPNTSKGDELVALTSAIETYETNLMNNETLEFEAVTNDKVEAERLKNISDKLISQRESLDINDIEFKVIKSSQSRIASAEVGVEARHKIMNIVVKSTSFSSQHQNKLASIELIKQEIANKS